jgi:hypothetical protein
MAQLSDRIQDGCALDRWRVTHRLPSETALLSDSNRAVALDETLALSGVPFRLCPYVVRDPYSPRYGSCSGQIVSARVQPCPGSFSEKPGIEET